MYTRPSATNGEDDTAPPRCRDHRSAPLDTLRACTRPSFEPT